MAKAAEEKTNVMRILDQMKIAYTPHANAYSGGPLDGPHMAEALGVPPETAFKTLVTRGASGGYYVYVVPVLKSLDLKAAAKAVGEKSVEMIKLSELLPLTGYVHGGCSPIGMKKQFPTVVDESARALPTMVFSAGKIGAQVELSPADLCRVTGASFAPISKEGGR